MKSILVRKHQLADQGTRYLQVQISLRKQGQPVRASFDSAREERCTNVPRKGSHDRCGRFSLASKM
jgi:hypothetical protein